jgi:hypothetical protein
MRAFLIAPYYITWHYSRALAGISTITGNFIWFSWHFFSVGVLARTLFAPWQRIHEEHKRGLDISGWLSTFLINLVMRGVGVFIRMIFIILGLVSMILAALAGMIVFLVWLVLPLAIIIGIIFAFTLMFRAP